MAKSPACWLLTVWMYLSLSGAVILLAHNGPYGKFWFLMLAAAACWLGLGRIEKADGRY